MAARPVELADRIEGMLLGGALGDSQHGPPVLDLGRGRQLTGTPDQISGESESVIARASALAREMLNSRAHACTWVERPDSLAYLEWVRGCPAPVERMATRTRHEFSSEEV